MEKFILKNYLNLFSLFLESEEKLEDLISKSIKEKNLKKKKRKREKVVYFHFSDISSLCNEQLGNSDGKSAKRFF